MDDPAAGFRQARRAAVGKAGEVLSVPVIVAWKDDREHRSGPEIPGGSEDRWQDYGRNFGGRLELTVAGDYHFIFTEASDFTEPDLNLTSIHEGNEPAILCVNDACTEEDRQRMGYFSGGGVGG
jgi:hypothetical protein